MDGKEVTPRPDTIEIPREVLDELTQPRVAHRQGGDGGGSKIIHWLGPLLSAVIAAGILVGVLGGAFYVRREEYTASERANAIAHVQLTETLAQVDKTLAAQTQAMTEMSKALNSQATELAVLRRVALHEK